MLAIRLACGYKRARGMIPYLPVTSRRHVVLGDPSWHAVSSSSPCSSSRRFERRPPNHCTGRSIVRNVSADGKNPPSVVEKPTTKKVAFSSVFDKIQKETGPRLPGMKEVHIPSFKPGEEWPAKPDPKKKTSGTLKFSTLAKLAEQITDPKNPDFARSFANRLWFMLMGRGLIHPLGLQHSDNLPTHPAGSGCAGRSTGGQKSFKTDGIGHGPALLGRGERGFPRGGRRSS